MRTPDDEMLFQFRLSKDLHARLQVVSDDEMRPMAFVARRAVQAEVERLERLKAEREAAEAPKGRRK